MILWNQAPKDMEIDAAFPKVGLGHNSDQLPFSWNKEWLLNLEKPRFSHDKTVPFKENSGG